MARLKKGDQITNFKYDTALESNLDFFEKNKGKKTIISFLRYNGCPVCKMEMADYKRDFHLLIAKDTQLFVVLQSTQEQMRKNGGDINFPFSIICDPKGKLFDAFGVKTSLIKFLNPMGILAVAKATVKGHLHGKFEGKETQMPATFVIDEDNKIISSYYGNSITDVPRISSLLNYI